MSPNAWQEQLRDNPFFESLPDSLRWHLVRAGVPTTFEAGAMLFRKGDLREFFAVVLTGSVAIEQELSPNPLATLGAGEVVGEGMLLDRSPHGTSARALVQTEAIVFDKDRLDPLLKDNPALHAALVTRAARAIAQRLRSADATLAGRGRTLGFTGGVTRLEHDLLGERGVPAEALYGVQTLRALENFPISGVAIREFPSLVDALAAVKSAAARANADLGLLAPEIAAAIEEAAGEIRDGRHHEHFLVDVIQGGAGTSTNMNANEVIANRALELMGRPRGEYTTVHPNNHVNLSQSTNDVYPTAVKLALHTSIEGLRAAMRDLVDAFLAKGREFGGYHQDGAHPVAGRRADDAGTGVLGLRPYRARGRRPAR